jgi:hypothetical protein
MRIRKLTDIKSVKKLHDSMKPGELLEFYWNNKKYSMWKNIFNEYQTLIDGLYVQDPIELIYIYKENINKFYGV